MIRAGDGPEPGDGAPGGADADRTPAADVAPAPRPRRRRSLPAPLRTPAYWLIRAAATAVGAAPLAEARRHARLIGHAFGHAPFNRKRLARAVENLRVAFPQHDDRHHRQTALAAYGHLFTLGVEMAFTQRLVTRDGYPARVDVSVLGPALRHVARGGPSIMITGHCGNWELLGHTLALVGLPVHALYRPLDLAPLDAWVRRTRASAGLRLVDKFGAGDELPGIMARGGIPGFVADQNAGDRGLFVPFFGRLASTYKSIGLLALQTHATIICGMARRAGPDEPVAGRALAAGEDPDLRYRLEIVDLIGPEDWAGRPDPLFYVTARYRRAIERMVRLAPEQYLWMHRYWKSRPRHERLGKPFPPALRQKLRELPWMTDDELARIEDHSARDARAAASA